MASPFNVFRRNQKVMLAILGIMAMIAFIFVPASTNFFSDNDQGGGATDTAVSTKYGDINEQELAVMVQNRKVINEFLRRLVNGTLQVLLQQGVQPQMVQIYQQRVQNQLNSLGLLADPTEASVVDSMILAKKGEEVGLVVSDREVNRLLYSITLQRLTLDQINQVISSVGASDRLIFDILRQELLASKVQALFVPALQFSLTPAQRWDYFQRMRRRASAEVAAVPVAPFIDKVPTPGEKELADFFATRKEEYQRQGSPKFGFHLPKRIALQYVRADFEKYNDPAAVTQEEIARYYEQYKDQRFLWSGRSLTAELEKPEAPAEQPPSEQPPGEQPPATPGTPEQPPATPDQPATPETPPAEPPATPEADQAPGADAPPAEPPAAPETPAPMAMRSRLLRGVVPALASAVLWQAPDAPPATPPGEAPSETPPATPPTDVPPATPPADTAPAAPPPTDAPPATDAPPPLAPPVAPAPPATPAWLNLKDQAVDYVLPRDITGGASPKHDPLWLHEDEIRRAVAAEAAFKKMDAGLKTVQAQMENYALLRIKAKVNKQPEPKPLDLATQAARFPGFTAATTGLISAVEMSQDPNLGSAVPLSNPNMPLHVYAYEGSREYTTQFAQDAAGNRYVYWITEVNEDHVPTLDEVRDQVILAWKTEQARPLAMKFAEELVAKAQGAPSLKEGLAGVEGIEPQLTGSFTWMTQGTVPELASQVPPRISQIPHVDRPGSEFMRQVFSMEVGQTKAIFNNPEDTVYVVRLLQFEPSTVVLREMFMAAELPSYVNAGRPEQHETFLAWVDEVKDDAHLHWHRVPDVPIPRKKEGS